MILYWINFYESVHYKKHDLEELSQLAVSDASS